MSRVFLPAAGPCLWPVLILCSPLAGLHAQTPALPNPGFETDAFAIAPGYADANGGAINGWTHTGNAGLSPTAGDSSIANNGAIPEGNRVAFLQSGTSAATLATELTGLTIGTTYTVSFRANARDFAAGSPAGSWSLNGAPYAAFDAKTPVGGNHPYRKITGTFTATAETAALVVKNDTVPNASTLLLDDFTIAQGETADWEMHPWTDEASMGYDPAHTLWVLEAWKMTVPIVPIYGPIIPEYLGELIMTGYSRVREDYNEILETIHASPELPSQMLYELAMAYCMGFEPVTITLTDLIPGKRYQATFYGGSMFGEQPERFTFSDATGSFAIDQSRYGSGKSLRIERDFIARGRTHDFRIEQHVSSEWAWSFHLNGIALAGYDPLVEITPGTDVTLTSQALDVPGPTRSGIIRNPGTEVLRISSIAMDDPHAAHFSVAAGTLPADIPPGGEIPYQITYQPGAYGRHPAALCVSIADEAAGSYELRPITLNGYASEPFDAWATRVFGAEAADPLIAGRDADPDGDGMNNELEYGLRMDPLGPGLPPLKLPEHVTADTPSLRFVLPIPAPNPALHSILQHSSDLQTWTDIYQVGTSASGNHTAARYVPGVTVFQNGPANVTIDVTSDSPFYHAQPGFWRLKVE